MARHGMNASQPRNTYRRGASGKRPWGTWRVVDLDSAFVVKRIVVMPGERLSLQRHSGRAEHWFIVEGSGTVTLGTRNRRVRAGEAVDIPVRMVHRLANDGKVPLTLIEIQHGPVLDEADIERLSDDYRRVPAARAPRATSRK